MEARLPDDKLNLIKLQFSTWLHKKKATKIQILSLVGLLKYACKVVWSGRTFVAQMYSTAAKVKKLTNFSHLNKSFKSDLYWWHMFINHWNGISLLRSATTFPDYHMYTDASGSWGFGAVFAGFWFQLPWPMEWSSVNIMAKKLVPIIISCAVWGPLLKQRSTEFHCDNQGLVATINKGSSKMQWWCAFLDAYGFSLQFLTSTSQQFTSPGSLIMQHTCCKEIILQNSNTIAAITLAPYVSTDVGLDFP